MDALFRQLTSIQPLSNKLLERLQEIIQFKHIAKRNFILKTGQVSRTVSFIEKGLLRCYLKQGDAQINTWFVREGDVCISVESFYKQAPSYECIQALEDSDIWNIGYEELQAIYRDFPEFNYHGRVLTERYHILGQQQTIPLRFYHISERFAFFKAKFPDLSERVPGRYLASYLGTTEETLSRIKNRTEI